MLLPNNGGQLLPDEPAIATVSEADIASLVEVAVKRGGGKGSRVREVALMAGESFTSHPYSLLALHLSGMEEEEEDHHHNPPSSTSSAPSS